MPPLLPVSFELVPAKDEAGLEKLKQSAAKLAELSPEFFSITFGAAGSTQQFTLDAIDLIRHSHQVPIAPHVSCVNISKSAIETLIKDYQSKGISRLVVIRGDKPEDLASNQDAFTYASELVSFIREISGDHFELFVGVYPDTDNPLAGVEQFQYKIDAGANRAITQYFYDPDAYFTFRDLCEKQGIQNEIRPGIMPITNYKQLKNFSDRCGAKIPRWLDERLCAYGDDLESIREYGLEVVSKMCERLIQGGAPGLHFYTLNRAKPAMQILNQL